MNHNQEQSQEERGTDLAISVIAATSKTPFKTAFKLTMGIYLAHLLGGLISFVFLFGIIYFLYSIFH